MIALLLVACLVGVDHPIFTSANADEAGAWTGYRATIQVRPLDYAIWPGGYLADGTFVQNGLLQYGDELFAFAWATHNTADDRADIVPLTYAKVAPAPLSWITFELAWTDGTWAFRYRDATGWHRQGSWRSDARLASFQVANEYWAPQPRPFGTQAVRGVQVRGPGWYSPPMSYGPPPETCGHESVESKTRGHLVFRSAEGPCDPYTALWR